MQCFPKKDSWKYIFILRTQEKYMSRSFDADKAKIEGTVAKIFLEQKVRELKTFMEDRKITIPNELEEFYADSLKNMKVKKIKI